MKKDELFKNIITESKLKAPENLKYRIIQQANSENLFLRKNRKEPVNEIQIKTLIYVLGGIYSFLLLVFLGGYFVFGKEVFQNYTFYYLSGTVVLVGFVLGIINYLDNKIRYKG